MVGEKMVDVVTALPPSDRQATAEVCNENTYECVVDEVLSNAAMASVVCSEHDLMLENC